MWTRTPLRSIVRCPSLRHMFMLWVWSRGPLLSSTPHEFRCHNRFCVVPSVVLGRCLDQGCVHTVVERVVVMFRGTIHTTSRSYTLRSAKTRLTYLRVRPLFVPSHNTLCLYPSSEPSPGLPKESASRGFSLPTPVCLPLTTKKGRGSRNKIIVGFRSVFHTGDLFTRGIYQVSSCVFNEVSPD